MRASTRRLIRRGSALAGLIGVIVSIASFPAKFKEAYIATSQSLDVLSRPAVAMLFRINFLRDIKSRKLVQDMHGNDVCILGAEMANFVGDGWRADIAIFYKPKIIEGNCSDNEDRLSISVFLFYGLSYNYAGTGGGENSDFPSHAEVVGSLIFQKFFGTDWPYIEAWYIHSGQLKHADNVQIILSDKVENEYELKTALYPGGVIGWGTPNGLFHLSIAPDGTLTMAAGLPPALVRPDVHAISLHWDGRTFRQQPIGSSSPSINRADDEKWSEFDDTSKNKDLVEILRLGPLSRLYVSGCSALRGFTISDVLPGALVPQFKKDPALECGGTGEEGETHVIKVEPK